MADIFLFIVLIAAVVGGIALVATYFSTDAVFNRKIKKVPYSKAAGCKDGQLHKIKGTITGIGEPLTAPLTKRKCVYYYVNVTELSTTKYGPADVTVFREMEQVPFVIKCGLHYIYIDDDRLKINFLLETHFKYGYNKGATTMLDVYLKKHRESGRGIFGFQRRLKFSEMILKTAQQVAVMGVCSWQTAQSLGLPEHYGAVLSIRAKRTGYVYVSDNP
jgi:hypothetical protein